MARWFALVMELDVVSVSMVNDFGFSYLNEIASRRFGPFSNWPFAKLLSDGIHLLVHWFDGSMVNVALVIHCCVVHDDGC